MGYEIKIGNVFDKIKEIEDECVDSVITSPPYFNLRDYENKGQIGLEKSPEEYIDNLVRVFREVRRVLKPTGTVWLNLGDSYWYKNNRKKDDNFVQNDATKQNLFKPKDLMMIPFRVAIALQNDGWFVRQDIVWEKGNAMPESVRDRCVKSHEYIFLLSKSKNYYYNHHAILEPVKDNDREGQKQGRKLIRKRLKLPPQKSFVQFMRQTPKTKLYQIESIENSIIDCWFQEDDSFSYPSIEDWRLIYPQLEGEGKEDMNLKMNDFVWSYDGVKSSTKGLRNKRSVWNVNTKAYKKSHFAVYPPELIEPCILTTAPINCYSCGKGYEEERIVENILTEIELNELEKSMKEVKKTPYAIVQKEFRKQFVEFRELPPHEILRKHLQDARKEKGYTINRIEEIFDSQAPHHWFERGGSYPSVKDYLKLKELIDLDDTYDKQMTEVFFKSGLKGDNEYSQVGFRKTCSCETEEIIPSLILDPFAGSGTTGGVAERHGRDSILIELNPEYAKLIPERIESIVHNA